jgi:hypothetical protein
MKAFVSPIPVTLSKAMHRVAYALAQYAPRGTSFTPEPREADIQFIHAIGLDCVNAIYAPKYVIIQYCLNTSDGDFSAWKPLWDKAELVWSYYPIPGGLLTPLGVDQEFVNAPYYMYPRDIGVMTSGYVSGPGAEAIEEVAIAAEDNKLTVKHLGPSHPQGMARRKSVYWSHIFNIEDYELARYYCRSRWVSGLRHVEGFELPILEGLVCGARPIVFDRPDMRRWYDGHAVFIPECSGKELIRILRGVFNNMPVSVSEEERTEIIQKFSWKPIIESVWQHATMGVGA